MGLVWSGAGAASTEVVQASHDLLAMQKSDGGWGQLPGYASDAYSTGESVYALHEAGIPLTDNAWQKGIQFLKSSQARDGTWHVHTRMLSPADISPPYFSTGFPYGKDEYLSYAGSCWAVMALLSSLPETAPLQKASPEGRSPGEDPTAPWIRTALFGTAAELASTLDSGLDPNSKTAEGTTLLMLRLKMLPGFDCCCLAAPMRKPGRCRVRTLLRSPRPIVVRGNPSDCSWTRAPCRMLLMVYARATRQLFLRR